MNQFKSRVAVIFLSVFVCGTVCAGKIVNNGWGSPTTTYFDPGSPPPGIPVDDDGAYAQPRVSITGGLISGTYGKDGCLRIDSMDDISISGYTRIYESNPPDDDLHNHELGHDKLNRFEFERNAEKKLKDAMKGFEKMKFCAANSKAALNKAKAERNRRFAQAKLALYKQMQTLGDLYDSKDYTDHNESTTMTADEAVEKIKERVSKVEKKKDGLQAGSQQKPPAAPAIPVNPMLLCSDPGAFRRFQEAQAGAIMFDPIGGMPVNPQNLADALRGALKVTTTSLVPVGKRDDYRQYFSDGVMTFCHLADANEIFMQAGVYQVTLEPSDRPGWSQMLHGVLDVWTAGVDNTIGSLWLETMVQTADQDRTSGFWMYFNEPLFDADGVFIADDAIVPCEVFFAPIDVLPGITQEDFEDYADTGQLMSQWMPVNAMLELTDQTAQGLGAMQFMYDTTGLNLFAEAQHQYMVPQDWIMSGRQYLQLWLQTDPNEPDVLENLYVKVFAAGIEQTVPVTDSPFDVHVEMAEDGYAAVSIPLTAFGMPLNAVERLSIGIEKDPLTGGAVSSFLIDEIHLADKPAEAPPSADLDEDFKVTLSDVAILASQWLAGI
jgi:hypothetical protein